MTRTCLTSLTLLALVAGPTGADEAVIMRDGFTLRGKVFKESEAVRDLSGGQLTFPRIASFDVVEVGPKFYFYSTHSRKGAEIEKDIPKDKLTSYKKNFPGSLRRPLPALGEMRLSEFNSAWRRTMEIGPKGPGATKIDQIITFLDPNTVYVVSTSHQWRQAYDTKDFGTETIRKLLSTHPETRDSIFGFVDPLRRIAIARFLMEVGWIAAARADLEKLKRDAPWAWSAEATEKYDKLVAEIDGAETRWIIGELEAMVNSSQYRNAGKFLGEYKPKNADAKDLSRLTELKAKIEIVQPRYDLTKRLLRELLDGESGEARREANAAVGGGAVLPNVPAKAVAGDLVTLLLAGEAVYAEVHPDTTPRLDTFTDVAGEDDKLVKAGKEPARKPEQLLALAITGWLKGKGGASPDSKAAVMCWNTRAMAMDYLREDIQNNRSGMLKKYLASTDRLPPDELAQLITLLPPIDKEDLAKIRGTKIDAKLAGVDGIYKIETGPVAEDTAGMTYMLRLPPEYHPGKSYPVVIALNDPVLDPEKMLGALAGDAARNGYILAAPVWCGKFGNAKFDYSGKDHWLVTATIRDLAKKFQIDQDRVFAYGFAQGANFALDLSMSRPDIFAGVVSMGPMPVAQFYQDYWRNAQKMPVYCITGETAGSSYDALRKIYERWLPLGYPSVMALYKGRGIEWYQNEVPITFDWMNRKARVRGNASLRLNATRFDSWQTMREGDNRFYWLGTDSINAPNKLKDPERPDKPAIPAQFRGDIRKNNEIVIDDVRGIRKVTIWLERDMINWDNDVILNVPAGIGIPKKKKYQPDLQIMFEELFRTGDRKMLFFGKIEIAVAG